MDLDGLKRYMVNKKYDIRQLTIKSREIAITISQNFITIIVGARRVGKTYSVLDLIINKLKLKDEEFIYLNLDDIELKASKAEDLVNAIDVHVQIYGKQPRFLIFDEVQDLDSWENAAYSLFEKKKYSIILTGPSSKLLSSDIATKLRGRTIIYHVYPLSFRESLSFNGFEPKLDADMMTDYDKSEIKHWLSDYLLFGGMPDVVLDRSMASRIFHEYVDLVVFKDLVERFGIKNVFVIKFLINSVLASFSKQYSINAVYERLKADGIRVSRKTLYSYSTLLEDAFFSFLFKKFYFSKHKSELSIPKVYLNDLGLASIVVDLKSSVGRSMENTVFIELKRMQDSNPGIELYYYWSTRAEVDFLIKEGGKVIGLIQVTYASAKDEINEREIKGLLEAAGETSCGKLQVITWDYEAIETRHGHKIAYIPLWKWLLFNRDQGAV